MRPRIVVVVDDLLVREGLVRLLTKQSAFDVVTPRLGQPELVSTIVGAIPDVVLIDERAATVDLAFEITSVSPTVGVIVLGRNPEPLFARALFERGMSRRGYLLHDGLRNGEQLAAAIRKVAGGGSEIDHRVVDALVEERRHDESPLARLTPRETEVLAEVASGKSNAAIARTLGITQRAVERRISSIFPKLELPDDQEISRRVAAALLFLSVSLNRERAKVLREEAAALHAQAVLQLRRAKQQ